ncbi:biotin synthase BioB [Haloglycomyces albus]|uniref:biotin synthase BioB n=1 Tax=Haloglycomyces albus TaxID=526067 RepID=UPI00046C9339|nr:biotin synthase BioB [Haloglycomyces albus]
MSDTSIALERLLDAAAASMEPRHKDLETVLTSSDSELMEVVAAASRLRFQHFGNRVKLNYLVNLKSGLCPENCTYCSQRLGSDAEVLKYSWLSAEEATEAAGAGIAGGASRVCLVASGRGPSERDVDRVSDTIASVKNDHPEVEVCACLGLLRDGQAEKLSEAGADAYNHNLNTSESHYESICTTHDYSDRLDTVTKAKNAQLSPCSGLIAGMGESNADLVEVALRLRASEVDSIPVNFLLPFDGTPLEGTWELDPRQCLRIVAMMRLANPTSEIRLAAGREAHLRTYQATALHIANSIFLGDYLTSEGQAAQADLDLLADAGMVPEEGHRLYQQKNKPQPRQRGAGTAAPPNA